MYIVPPLWLVGSSVKIQREGVPCQFRKCKKFLNFFSNFVLIIIDCSSGVPVNAGEVQRRWRRLIQ